MTLKSSRYLALTFAALFSGVANAADVSPVPTSACTNFLPPVRTGERIRDQSQLIGFTITATMVARGESDKNGILIYPPPQWCEEQSIEVNGKQHVLWHNIAADAPNASGVFDRISISGKSPSDGLGSISVIADRLAPTMRKESDPPAPAVVYDVILETDDEIQFLGSYTAPLTVEELTQFVKSGYVGINATIDKKSNKTTIYAPT